MLDIVLTARDVAVNETQSLISQSSPSKWEKVILYQFFKTQLMTPPPGSLH